MEQEICCPDCGSKIAREKVKEHLLSCQAYKPTYLSSISRAIDFMDFNSLKLVAGQLEIAKDSIDSKLEHLQKNQNGSSKAKGSHLPEPKTHINRKKEQASREQQHVNHTHQNGINNGIVSNLQQSINSDQQKNENKINVAKCQSKDNFAELRQDQICMCRYCGKSTELGNFIYGNECLHILCTKCFRTHVNNNYVRSNGKLDCPIKGCTDAIPSQQIKQIFDQVEFEKLETELARSAMDLIKCKNCSSEYEFFRGNPRDAPKKTNDNIVVSPAMGNHFASYRFLCPSCKSQQCKNCGVTPYHLGMDCESFKRNEALKKCRYCNQPLPPGYVSKLGIRSFDDICDDQDCRIRAKSACSKVHPCGHTCYGYINEKTCLPCLHSECAKQNYKQLDINADSYCIICYTEAYSSAPCVRSSCGHIFHAHCLEKRIEIKWVTPRIFFSFCQCPLCKKWIQLPEWIPMQKSFEKYKKLEEEIRGMALKRLKYEEGEKDEKVTEASSPFYQDPQRYAMAIYAYFQCHQCKKPYFGGQKSCAEAMNDQKGSEFNPKQLICPQCCPVPIKNCEKHGKEFISFKCKFCCSIAQWFCWGNTHFCDDCHKRQINGEYVSKKSKQQLPNCPGPQKCPVGGNHQGNGEQRSIGCVLCRNYKDSMKNF